MAQNPGTGIAATSDTPRELDNSLISAAASPALALWFNDELFRRAEQIALKMSKANGMIPKHLIGNVDACFMVVETALTWKLSPRAVAQSTYQPVEGGRIGYEGKLCIAILENSGKIIGPVKFAHFGDWTKIHGKFKIQKSDRGRDFAVATYTEKDEEGLGVTVSAQIRGEAEPREHEFFLRQAFPRNSTLWATDPKTQICYTAARRFASLAAPGIFMGVPFDREDELPGDSAPVVGSGTTVRPRRQDFAEPETAPVDLFVMVDSDGVEQTFQNGTEAGLGFIDLIDKAKDEKALEAIFESNGLLLSQLRERGLEKLAEDAHAMHSARLERFADLSKAAALKEARKAEKAKPPKESADRDAGQAEPAKDSKREPDQRTPAEETPPRKAFFAKQSYAMAPPVDGGKVVWSQWEKWMRSASRDCIAEAELSKLLADNAKHIEDFAAANGNAAYLLTQHFDGQRHRLTTPPASTDDPGYSEGR